jgi:hypothetical protein
MSIGAARGFVAIRLAIGRAESHHCFSVDRHNVAKTKAAQLLT